MLLFNTIIMIQMVYSFVHLILRAGVQSMQLNETASPELSSALPVDSCNIRNAFKRDKGPLKCADIMVKGIISVAYGTEAEGAGVILHHNRLSNLITHLFQPTSIGIIPATCFARRRQYIPIGLVRHSLPHTLADQATEHSPSS